MTKSNIDFDDVVEKYPNLFRDCQWSGHGAGWAPLLEEVCGKINKINETREEEPIGFIQVKEKFGQLRMYTNFFLEEVHEILCEAEDRSATICEVCGEAGILRDSGWMVTLCDKCNNERYKCK